MAKKATDELQIWYPRRTRISFRFTTEKLLMTLAECSRHECPECEVVMDEFELYRKINIWAEVPLTTILRSLDVLRGGLNRMAVIRRDRKYELTDLGRRMAKALLAKLPKAA